MTWNFTPLSYLYLLAMLTSLVIAYFAWRWRTAAGLHSLALALLCMAVYGLAGALELAGSDLGLKFNMFALEVTLSGLQSAFYFFFAFEHLGRAAWLTPARRRALLGVPLVFAGLFFTNRWHGWAWSGYRVLPWDNVLNYEGGPVFSLALGVQWIVLGIMLWVLFQELRRAPAAGRRRIMWLILGLALPLIPYFVFLLGPDQWSGVVLYPLGLTASALVLGATVFEYLDAQTKQSLQAARHALARAEAEVVERRRAETELRALHDKLTARVTEQGRKLLALYEVILVDSQAAAPQAALAEALRRVQSALLSDGVCYRELSGPQPLAAALHLDPALAQALAALPEAWPAHPPGEALALPDLRREADPWAARLAGAGCGAALVLRLNRSGPAPARLGVFWREPRPLPLEDIALFCALGEQMSLLVANADLRRRAEAAAVQGERRRLARELHDSVTQALYSLTLNARTALKRKQAGRLDALDETLHDLNQGAAQALREMRLMLYELRLEPLHSVDLAEALQTRLDAVERRAGLMSELQLAGPGGWPKAWDVELYPLAMEALNNALKHAGAGRVAVTLAGGPDWVELLVSDDGRGFQPEAVLAGGLGLKTMTERAERLAGRLTLDSQPGGGTRVRVTVGAPA